MNVVLALAAATVAQTAPPELVTLPLSTPADESSEALSAWSSVVAIMERRAAPLGVSTALQRKQHEFLVGPAREQAQDCGRDIDCLAEIGSALGAQILVVGLVAQRVALLAIRVEDRTVLAKARSPAKGSLEARAKRAAARLTKRLRSALRKRPAPAPPVLANRGTAPPPAPTPPAKGLLYIHRNQLVGVTRVSLDGEPVEFTGEGFVSFAAPSGDHTLVAVHIDGRQSIQTITLQPGQTTEVALAFPVPEPTPAPSPPLVVAPPPDQDDKDVTQTWWFWAAVGTAVIAGAATAAALASGAKGGPTPPNETGSIQGTY